jgi:D-sedoheptulose 7-phosphate isomerase
MSPERTDLHRQFVEADEHGVDALLVALAASAGAEAAKSDRLCRSSLEALGSDLERAAQAIARRFSTGACLYTFGNGASSTDAASVAALFSRSPGGTLLPARCLVADQAVLTAIGDDVGHGLIVSRQLVAFAQVGDIAMGYSTTGNSETVIGAFREAKHRGLLTVGFVGCEGGQIAASDVLDHCFVVRSHSRHRIQEAQAALSYRLWAAVQQQLAPGSGRPALGRQQPAANQELLEPEEAR